MSESRPGSRVPKLCAREEPPTVKQGVARPHRSPRSQPGLDEPLPFTPPSHPSSWDLQGRTRGGRAAGPRSAPRAGVRRPAPGPIPELPPGPRRGRPPAAASRAEPYPTSSQATGGAACGEAAVPQPTRTMLSSGRVRPSPSRGFPEPAPGQDRNGWVGWIIAEAASKSAY